MPLESSRDMTLRLRCPVCFGPLAGAPAPIVCTGCGRHWQEVDGFPALIHPAMDSNAHFPDDERILIYDGEERGHYVSWYRAKVMELLVKSLLPNRADLRVLDVGGGTGYIARRLSQVLPASRVTLVDTAPQALALGMSRGIRDCYLARAENLPFEDGQFDLAVSLDVYEHLDDDRAAVEEAHRVLTRGGIHIVFVPGTKLLWSVVDEMLNHRRRYALRDARHLLEQAGFEVIRATALLVTPLPLAVVVRLTRQYIWSEARARAKADADYAMPARLPNTLFKTALLPELWALDRMDFPWGVSLAVVGKKV